ncbi:phosphonate C-P lyase system protein PhnL [Roseibium sediminis]|uniref:phosphonate C-P lyase system protein PhnL n=1 Tax=Roseibium sediminis TaxID=1775174 RepID=UPI00123D6C66|nr:phosphonate C-P lyase system protein PhnL [Roseibium sediminis]
MVPLIVSEATKSFTMHMRGGMEIPVVAKVGFHVGKGECAVLGGPSGIGKSSILKMIYGNYLADSGQILVQHHGETVDIVTAEPRKIIEIRRESIGYVSQFLRVLPRVSALDVVAEPLTSNGTEQAQAYERASVLLERLNLPERLWSLPPATFSGGEQQRVNIARGFVTDHPVLLLDEPTASLDAANRKVVIDLINEKKATGAALLGIFHDQDVREAVADRVIDVSRFAVQKAA